MTAAAYTTDLIDLDLAQSTTNWTNVGTGALASETDFYVQNGNCISKPGWTGDATRGAIFNSASGKTINTPNAFFAWNYFWGPGALETEANGGMQMIIGSSTTAYDAWYIRGSDTILPFDGWACIPVDPSIAYNQRTGSPTATKQYFGVLARIKAGAAIGKGNPLGVDALRYGRGELRINGGDVGNGYATFAAAESTANSTTNRWGLFQAIPGGYQWQGLLTLGYTSAVDFRDSNRNIVVANTKKVTSGFNKLEVRQASSRVDWTSVSITALGTTSKGAFEAIDNATISFNSCTFTDMDTFVFKALSTVTSTTFRRCALVTTGGGTFSKCTFDQSTATSAVLCATPADATAVSQCAFISDGTGNGLEVTGTAANFTVSSTFTGYSGTGADAAIYVNTSAGNVEITYTGGGAQPTIRAAAGVNVTFATTSVPIAVKVINSAGANIPSARVIIEKSSDGTDILTGSTDANGELSTSFSYTASTPIIVRVRRASSNLGDGKLYKAFDGTGTITATGYSATVTMRED